MPKLSSGSPRGHPQKPSRIVRSVSRVGAISWLLFGIPSEPLVRCRHPFGRAPCRPRAGGGRRLSGATGTA
eukprot:4050006-Pyramimonas_sp.AAC.1